MKLLLRSLCMLLFTGTTCLKAQTCTEPDIVTGSTGCVVFTYRNTTVTYTTVRAADGQIWLQQNLGATAVATASNDEDAYGDLFQWGRWDDGHQLRNVPFQSALPNPNNPAGLGLGIDTFFATTTAPRWWQNGTATDTWNAATPALATATNGCDPCKALGADWQLPTTTQWQQLIAAENITNPATAFASNLKLPATGVRQSSNAFDFVGTRGYYWSSDASNTTGYGKYFYLGSTTANASAGSYRAQGAAIRCLKMASTLPVQWKSVTARLLHNQNVQVEWETAQEINTDHFTIQRSYDGRQYQNIGTVKAVGSHYVYQFTDALLTTTATKLYYRIQQWDKDGRFAYSSVATVDVPTQNIRIGVNTASQELQLYGNGNTQPLSIVVTDMQGRTMHVQQSLQNIAISNWPAGIYVVRIQQGKQLQTLRFVKP